MTRQHLALGADEVESLILAWPLFLRGAEEVTACSLGLANLVEIERHGDAVARNETNHVLVGEGARTEPIGIASAALEWVVAGGPDQHRPLFLLSQSDALFEIEQPRDF